MLLNYSVVFLLSFYSVLMHKLTVVSQTPKNTSFPEIVNCRCFAGLVLNSILAYKYKDDTKIFLCFFVVVVVVVLNVNVSWKVCETMKCSLAEWLVDADATPRFLL